METVSKISSTKTKSVWAARALKTLGFGFLLLDCAMKLLRAAPAVKATMELGYPESAIQTIGLVQLVCLVLYLVPRTSPFGALLLTGYLGGAVASQVRVDAPLFSAALFPIYAAVLIWAPLVMQDQRVRSIFGLTGYRPATSSPSPSAAELVARA